jgi:hypothetical protein
MSRKTQPFLAFLLLLVGVGFGLVIVRPASAITGAAPVYQPTPFPTPTPGPDGRIVYIVQEGDTPWRIAAIAGISVEELMIRNGMELTDFITVGMELEIGVAGPPSPTPVADLEPTPSGPSATPTPLVGTGEICVFLFLDMDGDSQLDEGEASLPDGKVSVADVNGSLAGEHTTDLDPESYCFKDLMNGDYNVSAAVPPDHNPTTVMNLPVRLEPGAIKYVQFGAQPNSAIASSGDDGEGGRSSLLGILGFLLLLAGVGLGYYAARYQRGTPKSLR